MFIFNGYIKLPQGTPDVKNLLAFYDVADMNVVN